MGVQWWGRDLQIEDVIVLAQGSDVPLVLRADAQGCSDEGAQYYRMVGIACLDGLMENLEPDEELLQKIKHKRMERLRIR